MAIINKIFIMLIVALLATVMMAQNDSTLYMSLVDSSFQQGNRGEYKKAIDYLNKAIKLDSTNKITPMLINNIAGLQQLLGKYDEAILSYDRALKQDPDQETIRYNKALLEGKLGYNKAALTDYSLLIAKHPNNELYHYQRAMIYILTNEYNFAEADLKFILNKNNKSLKAREGYALLETLRGNYDQAEQLYNYIIEKLPSYSKAYEDRARMFLSRNMVGFALRDAEKALELSKNKPRSDLFILRAEIYKAMGNREGYLNEMKKAERQKDFIMPKAKENRQ